MISAKTKNFIIFALLFCCLNIPPETRQLYAAGDTDREENAISTARRAFEDGFYELALTLFQRFLDNFPESKSRDDASFYIGQCYFYQKRYGEAINQFNGLFASADGEPLKDRYLYWLAETYFARKDYRYAYSLYERLYLQYHNSSYRDNVLYSLGWCSFQENEYSLSKEKFLRLIKEFPGCALVNEALVKAAECMYQLKEYSELKSYCLDALNKIASVGLPVRVRTQTGLSSDSKEPQGVKANPKIALLNFYLAESCFYLGDYDCALTYYTEARDTLTDTAGISDLVSLGLAWSYLKSGDYQKAKAGFDDVLTAHPQGENMESALLGSAMVLRVVSQWTQAVANYEKLIAITKNARLLAEARLGKAETFYSLEKYPQTIAAYRESEAYIRRVGDKILSDRLNYGLGLTYLKMKNFKEALDKFSLAAESDDRKTKISALSKTADVYFELRETNKAIGIYHSILKDYPDYEDYDYIKLNSGLSLLKISETAQALEIFKQLIRQARDPAISREAEFYLAQSYYDDGDFLNSYLTVRRFLNKYPNNPLNSQVLFLAGLSLKSLKRYKEAYDTFKSLSKTGGEDAEFLAKAEFEMSDCLYYLGRADEAYEKLEFLRSKYTDYNFLAQVLLRLSEYYFKDNKFDTAIRYLLSLILDYPESRLLNDGYYLLGLCYEGRQDYLKAIEAFKQVKGGDFRLYSKLAALYRLTGKLPQAVFYYRLSLKKNPLNPAQLKFNLAECLEESGLTQEAVSEYSDITDDDELFLKGLLRSAKLLENEENWPAAISVYEKLASLNVEESKFAQERIDLIKARYLSGKRG